MRYFLLIVPAILLLSCSKNTYKLFDKKSIVASEIDCTLVSPKNIVLDYPINHSLEDLHLKYLGSGGYYIGNKSASILIDPFFSPYQMVPLTFTKIVTNTENVEMGLADIREEVYETISGLFVTHSHYDHLLNVPYVFNHYLDTTDHNVKIYGSSSVKTITKSVVDSTRIIIIEDNTSSIDNTGQWIYMEDSTIRVLPTRTKHAPHYKKIVSINLYKGEAKPINNYTTDLTPTFVTKWKEGSTYAYLIDFLDNDRPYFRIYLLSSASSPPMGFVNNEILKEHPVNLAILGAASAANVENYPMGILEHIKPEKLLIAHWEDLFKPYMHNPPRLIRATNFKKLIPSINAVYPWKMNGEQQVYMPYPGVHIHFSNSSYEAIRAGDY